MALDNQRSIQTDPDTLAVVLFDIWKMLEPQMVLCIIGGAGATMTEHLEKEFIRGITDAAFASDAWIITNGYKQEVVPRVVGEIIYKNHLLNPKNNLVAIGVSKWANIKERSTLQNKTSEYIDAKREIGKHNLEQHHTHFILLDDGTLNPSDSGGYRSKLAREISRGARRKSSYKAYKESTQLKIVKILLNLVPLVTIVVAGGLHTLTFLLGERSLRRIYEDDIREGLCKVFKEEIKDLTVLQFHESHLYQRLSDGLIEISLEMLAMFMYCLQKNVRTNIKIFSINIDTSLYDTIFDAYIKARETMIKKYRKQLHHKDELNLALKWSRAKAAKEHLNLYMEDMIDIASKRILFMDALKKDLPAFISNFIKLGFDLTKILCKDSHTLLEWCYLAQLYNDDEKRHNVSTANKRPKLIETF
ncbi:unnamed protein product [Didymodactylos carnosus]|uniref:TRPM SLOG domain-containing protein n=1 Tax=Didymodactylos carnosus TaxID=1234261 RepID=A0A815EJA6_9BILA|nr:unnamed protein product [Didymodactylos carnosus]CAF4148719.1 unnamed protein product [Didymodactylos carnosus]